MVVQEPWELLVKIWPLGQLIRPDLRSETCFIATELMLLLLQVITNRDSGETLLCIAYVFEVSTAEHGTQHHIYKLVKE